MIIYYSCYFLFYSEKFFRKVIAGSTKESILGLKEKRRSNPVSFHKINVVFVVFVFVPLHIIGIFSHFLLDFEE